MSTRSRSPLPMHSSRSQPIRRRSRSPIDSRKRGHGASHGERTRQGDEDDRGSRRHKHRDGHRSYRSGEKKEASSSSSRHSHRRHQVAKEAHDPPGRFIPADESRRHDRHHHKRHAQPHVSTSTFASKDISGTVDLPLGARALTRGDFSAFEPLFSYYLDVQKGLNLRSLPENEVAGRWKSFLGKWNRGELAQGWYDPEIHSHTLLVYGEKGGTAPGSRRTPPATATALEVDTQPKGAPVLERHRRKDSNSEDDDDDIYGPPLPPARGGGGSLAPNPPTQRFSASVPRAQDLALLREREEEERAAAAADLRLARKADRTVQKERLDELLPRAEPGTRERQLEKRRAAAESNRAFREASPDREVDEGELMGGGGEADADEYKRMLLTMQRRKTERELQREADARARQAEREERLQVFRDREEIAMERFREIARQKFGAGS